MTVYPIGGTTPELPESRPAAQKPEKATPQHSDQLELNHAAGPKSEATYSRSDVVPAKATTQSVEVTMAQDARAQKLASIRQRMEAGVYNSREIIERVVDRLLDRWNLNESGGTSKTSS
jgi:anti-sigma28 factor (negative regulator of flagellin synthesis)